MFWYATWRHAIGLLIWLPQRQSNAASVFVSQIFAEKGDNRNERMSLGKRPSAIIDSFYETKIFRSFFFTHPPQYESVTNVDAVSLALRLLRSTNHYSLSSWKDGPFSLQFLKSIVCIDAITEAHDHKRMSMQLSLSPLGAPKMRSWWGRFDACNSWALRCRSITVTCRARGRSLNSELRSTMSDLQCIWGVWR